MITVNELEVQEAFQLYRKENIKVLGLLAIVIYTLLAFVDSGLAKESIWVLITIRFLFALPTALFALFVDKINPKHFDAVTFFCFIFLALGISIISYLIGGIESDYYFGLIIISFVQFAFLPINLKLTLCLDLLFFAIFFLINTIPFNYPSEEIIKQASNFFSFSLLKFFVVRRSHSLIMDALRKVSLERELENQKHTQQILGELCHLFNNPLFISMSIIKKLSGKKDLDPESQKKLTKVYESNNRMAKVLKRMLDITEKKSKVDIQDLVE